MNDYQDVFPFHTWVHVLSFIIFFNYFCYIAIIWVLTYILQFSAREARDSLNVKYSEAPCIAFLQKDLIISYNYRLKCILFKWGAELHCFIGVFQIWWPYWVLGVSRLPVVMRNLWAQLLVLWSTLIERGFALHGGADDVGKDKDWISHVRDDCYCKKLIIIIMLL